MLMFFASTKYLYNIYEICNISNRNIYREKNTKVEITLIRIANYIFTVTLFAFRVVPFAVKERFNKRSDFFTWTLRMRLIM